MLNTLQELEDAQLTSADILDHDGCEVSISDTRNDFVEMATLVDRVGFEDACLLLADYCYARAVLEKDTEATKSWRDSALLLSNDVLSV